MNSSSSLRGTAKHAGRVTKQSQHLRLGPYYVIWDCFVIPRSFLPIPRNDENFIVKYRISRYAIMGLFDKIFQFSYQRRGYWLSIWAFAIHTQPTYFVILSGYNLTANLCLSDYNLIYIPT